LKYTTNQFNGDGLTGHPLNLERGFSMDKAIKPISEEPEYKFYFRMLSNKYKKELNTRLLEKDPICRFLDAGALAKSVYHKQMGWNLY
jgi:hypothetical protein